MPLTAHLEQAFASRGVRAAARHPELVLAAALNDADDPAEIIAAASRVTGRAHRRALHPRPGGRVDRARRAGARFRHPLVRSAIHQMATAAQRQAPMRRSPPSSTGSPTAACGTGLRRASALGRGGRRRARAGGHAPSGAGPSSRPRSPWSAPPDSARIPGRRGRRLLRAAPSWRSSSAGAGLSSASSARPSSSISSQLDRGRMALDSRDLRPGITGHPATVRRWSSRRSRQYPGRHRSRADTSCGPQRRAPSGPTAARRPATRCVDAARAGRRQRRRSAAAVDPRLRGPGRTGRGGDRARVALGAPTGRVDPGTMQLLGNAASTLNGHELAERLSHGLGRRASATGPARRSWPRCSCCAHGRGSTSGEWNIVIADAEEAGRSAGRPPSRSGRPARQRAQAMLAGMRGDEDAAAALAADGGGGRPARSARGPCLPWSSSRAASRPSGGALGGRIRAAEPDRSTPPIPPITTWTRAGPRDLAEAAAHSGHRDEARALMARWSRWPSRRRRHAPRGHAPRAALLADDEDAEALSGAGLRSQRLAVRSRAPAARLRRWLRRRRRVRPTRAPRCGRRGTASTPSGRSRGASGPARSCAPRASPAAAARPACATSSPRRSSRSPKWSPKACPTARSASGCISRTARSARTCIAIFPKLGHHLPRRRRPGALGLTREALDRTRAPSRRPRASRCRP